MRAKLDPDGRFTNPYLDRVLGPVLGLIRGDTAHAQSFAGSSTASRNDQPDVCGANASHTNQSSSSTCVADVVHVDLQRGSSAHSHAR